MTEFDIEQVSKDTKISVDEIKKMIKVEFNRLTASKEYPDVAQRLAMAIHNTWMELKGSASQIGEDIRVRVIEVSDPNDWVAAKIKEINAYTLKNGKFKAEQDGYIRIERNKETGEELKIVPLYYWKEKEDKSANRNYGSPLPAKSYILGVNCCCTRVNDEKHEVFFGLLSISGDNADPANAAFFNAKMGEEIELKAQVKGVRPAKLGNGTTESFMFLDCRNATYRVVKLEEQRLANVDWLKFIQEHYNFKLDKYNDLRWAELAAIPTLFKATQTKHDAKKNITKEYTDPIFASLCRVTGISKSNSPTLSHRLTVTDPKDERVPFTTWVNSKVDINFGPGTSAIIIYRVSRQDSTQNPGTKEFHLNARGFHVLKTELAKITGISEQYLKELLGEQTVALGSTKTEDFSNINEEELDKLLGGKK